MSDLNSPNTAQKARLLVDGANPAPDAVITSNRDGVVQIDPADGDGNVFVEGLAAADVTITVVQGGRSGSDDITVTDAPLAISLDIPEPK